MKAQGRLRTVKGKLDLFRTWYVLMHFKQVNCVMMRGVNDDEIIPFVEFAMVKPSTRFCLLIFWM